MDNDLTLIANDVLIAKTLVLEDAYRTLVATDEHFQPVGPNGTTDPAADGSGS